MAIPPLCPPTEEKTLVAHDGRSVTVIPLGDDCFEFHFGDVKFKGKMDSDGIVKDWATVGSTLSPNIAGGQEFGAVHALVMDAAMRTISIVITEDLETSGIVVRW